MVDLRREREFSPAATALHTRGVASKKSGLHLAAKTCAMRGLVIEPDCGALWNLRGAAEWSLGDFDGARASLARAVELSPADHEAWVNYGLVLSSLRRYDEADRCYRQAMLLTRKLDARWNLALNHLDRGDWAQGFKDYECRFEYRGETIYKKLPYPMWRGEDVNGKTLFVHSEQGAGDHILFSRYLAEVKQCWPGASIKFICPPDMQALLWEFHDIVEFLPNGIPWPTGIDYACHMMSLPGIFGTTPATVPAEPGRIRKLAEQHRASVNLPRPLTDGSLRIGIAWTGNPSMDQNDHRSMPVELLLELAWDPAVTLYSLQCPPGNAHLQFVQADELICDLSPALVQRGYVGTAAVMLNLDLVVTVCTSVAHLAGALGVPCWTMLCYNPYWIWLNDESTTTDWYPSMRLYRQPAPGDWRSVIDLVKHDLKHHLRNAGDRRRVA